MVRAPQTDSVHIAALPEVVREELIKSVSGARKEDGEVSRRGCNGLSEVRTQMLCQTRGFLIKYK